MGFCVSREGKNWQWRTYHISHPNGNKKGGTPFQYTNKKDKLTNKFKSVIVRPRTRRKKVSEWFFVPLSASLPVFSFSSNWKAVLWKKMKTLSWWLHSGKLSFQQTSIKRGDDKRFFFYGPNFQNKKSNRLDLQGHSVYRTCHKNYRYPPGIYPRLGCKKGEEKSHYNWLNWVKKSETIVLPLLRALHRY